MVRRILRTNFELRKKKLEFKYRPLRLLKDGRDLKTYQEQNSREGSRHSLFQSTEILDSGIICYKRYLVRVLKKTTLISV
jgi:hypothetical protein